MDETAGELLTALETVLDCLGALSDRSELWSGYGLTEADISQVYAALDKGQAERKAAR